MLSSCTSKSSLKKNTEISIFLKIELGKEAKKQREEKLFDFPDQTSVSVHRPKTSSQSKQTPKILPPTIYQFSHVFRHDTSQEDFFNGTIFPSFENFFKGESLLIFSYGVTDSGKTYTMQGTDADPGLIPRTLTYLFETLESRQNFENKETNRLKYKPLRFDEIEKLKDDEYAALMAHKDNLLKLSPHRDLEQPTCSSLANINVGENKHHAIWISFYELYNQDVFDLLALKSTTKFRTNSLGTSSRPKLRILNDNNQVPYVENLTYIPISSTMEAIKVLKYGEKNLQKASNSINRHFSRSYAVLCLKIVSLEETSPIDKSQCNASINHLTFCDLAGSERNMQTKTTETVSKEASDNPLTVLSRCLSAMVSDQKTGARQVLIPFMDSDLNFLLKAYFEGRGTVKMIVNFNPSLPCFDESVEVLEFSSILAKEGDKNVQYQISAKKAASGEESGEDESGEEVSGSDECVAEDEADDSEDVEETLYETVDESPASVKVTTNKSISKSLKLKDGGSQTAVVATRSVEVEANLSTEELKQTKSKLALKAQECESIKKESTEKINKLNGDIHALKSEHAQEVKGLQVNHKTLSDRFEALEKDYQRTCLELTEKGAELKEIESDLKEVRQCLEKKNLAYEQIQNDNQYHSNQVEKMELQAKQAEAGFLELSNKLEAEQKRFAVEQANFVKEMARSSELAEKELAQRKKEIVARESEALQQLRAAAVVKSTKTKLTDIQIDENMSVSKDNLKNNTELKRNNAEEAAALAEIVKTKPPKTTSKSSLKAQTSATSLKKSSQSKNRDGSKVKDFNSSFMSIMSNMGLNKDMRVPAEKTNEKVEKQVKLAKKADKKTKLNLMDRFVKLEDDMENSENQIPGAVEATPRKSGRNNNA